MKLGVAQVNPTVGDLEGNVRLCRDAIHTLTRAGADLVVLPEMALPGYPPRDILMDASFIEAAQAALRDLAARTRADAPALVGSVSPSGGMLPGHPGLHNTAFLTNKGNITVAGIKLLLPAYDVYLEPRWFIPGPQQAPISVAGCRLGVIICEDMWDEGYPLHPGAELVGQGSELLVCISASPYRQGQADSRLHHARRQGQRLVYVNLVGANDELIFDGRSFFIGTDGSVMRQLPAFQERLEVIDLEARSPEWSENLDAMEELFDALRLGISDFMRKNGLQRIFIGASGGIDSSVALALACKAMDPKQVTAVAIPSRYTDPRSTETARRLASSLGANFERIDLEPLHHMAEIQMAGLLEGTGAENLQARLRMLILMGYVNRHGGILLNTSNKTELSLGYSTLYGDMSGALSPLGDLTKPDVYRLARWINMRYDAVIPEFAIQRPPSAELGPDQVDPFDYNAISPQIEAMVLRHQSNHALRISEHKRRQMGIILKVSETAFGTGRLIPVTRK